MEFDRTAIVSTCIGLLLGGYFLFGAVPAIQQGCPLQPIPPNSGAHRLTIGAEKELVSLLPAAEKGDTASQIKIGDLFQARYGLSNLDCMGGDTSCAKDVSQYQETQRLELKSDDYVPGYSCIRGDNKESLKWFLKAAEQGDAKALARVGDLYRVSRGIKQDPQEAYFWFSLAANAVLNADPLYAVLRDDLAEKLTAEQIESVKKRVAEWKPKK